MRVDEAIVKLGHFFQKKGIENARTDAEWLLAHVLRCKRLDLFLNYNRVLTLDQKNTLRELAKTRAQRYPLQYIIGSVHFYGQEIHVDPRVLIPRPETEELVYQLNQYLTNAATTPTSIIDLGTGSGSIAIALAHLLPQVHVTASDKYEEALVVARNNAIAHQCDPRIQFIQSNWFEHISGKFDCIVSNPPYLSESEWDTAQAEIKHFEPKHALVAAENGLSDLKILLENGRFHLNPGGCIALETGVHQHAYLHNLAQKYGYRRTKTSLDLHKRERFFWAWL